MPAPRYRLNIAVTLDGFIADENGGVGFLDSYHDAGYDFTAFLASISLMIQGANTYRQVLGFGAWPYGAIPNIVFSSHPLPIPDGARVRFHAGPVESLVEELADFSGDIWIVGGAKTIAALLNGGVRPRMELAIVPELLGRGIPLFCGHNLRASMRLAGTKKYGKGLLVLEYEPLPA